MASKKYTVLLIPEGSAPVRKLHVRAAAVKFLAVCLMAVFVVAGVLVGHYYQSNIAPRRLLSLNQKTVLKDREIAHLRASLEEMRRQMMLLSQTEAQLRQLADLETSPVKGMVGLGGIATEDDTRPLNDMQSQIDQLRAQIDLQRTSYEQIHGILNNQRSLLAATPEGHPAKGWLTSQFGHRKDPFTGQSNFHSGLDFAAPTGTPIYATADGVVVQAKSSGGYGKTVTIDHGYGYQTRYAHTSRMFVKVGDQIKRGQKIAAVGSTGRSTGPHLHYEVVVDGVPVNPKKFM